jgi:hypothetical protein
MHIRRRLDQVTTPVDGGVQVSSPNTAETHFLSPVAAAVWAACDGQTAVDGLWTAARAVDPSVARALVWQIADQLADAGLVDGRLSPPVASAGLDRRGVLRTAALAAAALAVAPGLVRAQARNEVPQDPEAPGFEEDLGELDVAPPLDPPVDDDASPEERGDDQAVERQVKQGGDPLPDPLTEDEFLSLLDEWDQEAEFSLREADALGKVDYEDGVDTREEIAALRERRAELYVKRSRERKAKQLLSAERRNQRADERTHKESEVQARQAEAQDKRASRNLEQRAKLDARREESRKERAGLQGEQRIKLDARLSEEQEKLSARHREADEKANFLRRKAAEEKQKLDAQQREAQQKFAVAQRDQWNDGRAGAQEETVKLRGEQNEKQLVRGRKVEQRFKQEARFREKDQKLARNQEKEAKVFRSREELTKFNAARAAEEREKQADGVTQ